MHDANTLYVEAFVEALLAGGLRHVCLAPGSRHTPLVLAFARRHQQLEISSHLDERSAAFFALGLGLATGQPAALVCTSGTAAANFFPAVIEAHQSRLPLLVLTGDRPPELRGSGANQTIDQLKLFGDYAGFFADAPLPQPDPPDAALRHMQSLAARAYATARSGTVAHINFPFRKPLEPASAHMAAGAAARAAIAMPVRSLPQPSGLRGLLPQLCGRRGLIYCGHGTCRSAAERRAFRPWLQGLSAATGYPILAEFSSNLRTPGSICMYESFYAALAQDFAQVKVLIRFGAPPLSRAMQDFLAQGQLQAHIYGSRDGEWADASHSVTHQLQIAPLTVSAEEWDSAPVAASLQWHERIWRVELATRQIVADELAGGAYFDGAALADIVALLPGAGGIFAGNSLPIRHLDQFGGAPAQAPLAWANRGASGIDGNVSTALGIAAAQPDTPLVAVLGDITLYHDMNGLLAARRSDIPLTIILLNNGGGGIFQRLPVRAFDPYFSDYFLTAHGLDFAAVAQLYGFEHLHIRDRSSLHSALQRRRHERGCRRQLLELTTDSRTDDQRRREIMQTVQRRLSAGHFSGE